MSEYHLAAGPHHDPKNGRCAMEWVAWIAGERHSDTPACVSPLLGHFCMAVNDGASDEDRQRLRPYLARCIGTVNDGFDSERKRVLGIEPDYPCTGYVFPSKAWTVGVDMRLQPFEESLALLDQMLPTVAVELPEEAAQRAREVCEAAA